VELKGVRTTLNLEDALSALGVRGPETDDEHLGDMASAWGGSMESGRDGLANVLSQAFPAGGADR